MNSTSRRPASPQARTLAALGALVTGVVGVSMAVYSVIGGEETGGAALLAASALAFGLLALSLDRTISGLRGASAQSADLDVDAASANGSGLRATQSADGHLALRPQRTHAPSINAEPLTNREHQVLALVAEGNSNKLISADLGISERTVKNHLTATMTKLRASDRTHAVVTAVRLGWLEI